MKISAHCSEVVKKSSKMLWIIQKKEENTVFCQVIILIAVGSTTWILAIAIATSLSKSCRRSRNCAVTEQISMGSSYLTKIKYSLLFSLDKL